MAASGSAMQAREVGSILVVTGRTEFARRLRAALESHRRVICAESIEAATNLIHTIAVDVVFADAGSIDPFALVDVLSGHSVSAATLLAAEGRLVGMNSIAWHELPPKLSVKDLARTLVVLSTPGVRRNLSMAACISELVSVSGLTMTQTAMLCCFVARGSDKSFARTHQVSHATLKSHRHAILANTGFASMLALRSAVLATALGLESDGSDEFEVAEPANADRDDHRKGREGRIRAELRKSRSE